MALKTLNLATDISDLSDKIILVTSRQLTNSVIQPILTPCIGSVGLGFESIKQLALHNPLKICNSSKGSATVSSLKETIPSDNNFSLPIDLSSFKSIRTAAEEIFSTSPRLDILINNVGIMVAPLGLTAEGIGIQLGTNYIDHASLKKSLLPLLLETAQKPGSDVCIVDPTTSPATVTFYWIGKDSMLVLHERATATPNLPTSSPPTQLLRTTPP